MFKETEVDECEIIVIGHLKWNPYFGEKKRRSTSWGSINLYISFSIWQTDGWKAFSNADRSYTEIMCTRLLF